MSDPRRSRPSAGFTLPDLLAALALLAVALGLAVPVARATLDRRAVISVRDQALAALHRARLEARVGGGAVLELDGEAGTLRVSRGDSVLWWSPVPGDQRVRITLPAGGSGTTVRFDALGLGVMASRTILFRRGNAEARLVVSSRGRGRRS